MASMPDAPRQGAVGFAIGNYGYITTGAAAGGTPVYSDTWQYDPVNNTWLQRASFPGSPRSHCDAFVLNNEAFVIGGTNFNNTASDQVYKYDPAADSWLFIGVFPGGPRHHSSASASVNSKGYFGQGCYSVPSLNEWYTTNDWWELEIVTGVGIEENESENVLNIFPNPASTQITLDVREQTLPSSIHLYNMNGQHLETLKPASEKITIDISSYTPGNYIVQASFGKKIVTQKFVKE